MRVFKNYVFMFFLLFMFSMSAVAQSTTGSITGRVFDAKTLQPLSEANVQVLDSHVGTTSDRSGNFNFNGLQAGNYNVSVSVIGYEKQQQSVVVKSGQTASMIFKLLPVVLKMRSVAVEGEKERNVIQRPRSESVGLDLSTSVITRRDIQKQGAKTLVEAMDYIPGAWIETRGRKVKQFFSIRGQRYPYPEYAVDGVWQREFHELPYFFSTADIERIEVIRSSAALLTGLSGMAGVINIVPKTYNSPEFSHEIEYGSYGSYRLQLSHGARVGDVSYASGIGIRHTDGPSDMNAKEEMANFYGRVNWQASQKLGFQLMVFHLNGERQMRLAKAPASSRFQTEISGYDPYRSTLASLKMNYTHSERSNIEAVAYYSHRDPEFYSVDSETNAVSKTLEKDYEYGLSVLHAFKLSSNNTLRWGGLYNHWVTPNGKRFYSGRKSDLYTYSGVLVDEHQFHRLTLDAGVRLSKTYINEYGAFGIDGSAKGFAGVEPIKDTWEPIVTQASLGGSYLLTESVSVFMNSMFGIVQPRKGTFDVDLNEPQNEKRIKLDIGTKFEAPCFGSVSITGYGTVQKNAIVLSGQSEEINGYVAELYANRDQDQLGVELELRSKKMWDHVQFFTNLITMRSRKKADDEMVENDEIPDIISNTGLSFDFAQCNINLYAKYMSEYESTRFVASTKTNPATPQPLGDFMNFDATAEYQIAKTPATTVFLQIKNIFDEKYSTVVGYPDFGRQVFAGIRQSF